MKYYIQGEKIRKLREQRSLTQKQISDMLNISHQAFSKYERGLSCPSLNNQLKLTYILKANIVELYLVQPPLFPNDLQIKRALANGSSIKNYQTNKIDHNLLFLLIKLFSFLDHSKQLEVFHFINLKIKEGANNNVWKIWNIN